MRNVSLFVIASFMLSGSLYSQSNQPVVMTFAGDLNLSENVERYVGSRVGYVFSEWKPGNESDIFMVNLENPVTRATEKVEKKYNFKMDPIYLQTLLDGGVTIVTCANNHVFDYGLQGIDDTMRNLDSAGIYRVGIGRSLADSRTPVVLERKGKKIGFLAYFGGGDYAATSGRAGFAPRRTRDILKDVRKLRGSVDYVVVNFHWGAEREPIPELWQRTLAHKVIDAGADLIVGHHPHVLQGLEEYHGKWIAYSLGNFVFGGNSLNTYQTAVLKVTLDEGACRVELVPVSVRRWRPSPATGKARETVMKLVEERSAFADESSVQTGAPQP